MGKYRNNVYRDGRVHVCARLCKTCIYRPDSPLMSIPIKEKAFKNDTCIPCHSTLDGRGKSRKNLVCRGFFENHKTAPLQIAERLDLIVFEEPPK